MKWIILILLAATAKPVTISSTPAFSSAPSTVRITVHVERREENRSIRWACLSTKGFETSSTYQLDGEKSFATKEVYLKDLPAGDYYCQAVLDTVTGSVQSAPTQFHVLER